MVVNLTGDEAFDLVVVGAGIVGSVAADLARRKYPDWRIALLERSLVGLGASGYSAGIDIPLGRTARQRAMSEKSARFYSHLRLRDQTVPIYPIPLFWVVKHEDVERFKQRVVGGMPRPVSAADLAAAHGLPATFLLPEESVAFLDERASYSHPGAIADALARRFARSPRSSLWEGVRVDSIRSTEGVMRLSFGDGRRMLSRRVLLAIGPWAGEWLGETGSGSARVRVKKVVALHVDCLPAIDAAAFGFFGEDAYLIPMPERGHWLFSFTSPQWEVSPESSRLSIDAQDRRVALDILERYVPGFVEHCRGGRVFCDSYSEDWTPHVGRIDEVDPNLVVATGCSGSGYRLAPGIAEEALDLFTFADHEGESVA
jgi:glycine/D-amino acid oxidase-like deaminating enzyme